MRNQKEYSSGGALPIFSIRNVKYLILVKRSEKADTNPGSHSGFFGWANNEKENLNPDFIAKRELLEEILITSKDREKVFNLVFKNDDICKRNKITEDLIDVWNEEKLTNIKKDDIYSFEQSNIKEVEFIEPSGWTKIFILEFQLNFSLDKICIYDGETKDDIKRKGLLDREIDIFNLSDFKKWWRNSDTATLNAEISFKTGKQELIKGAIDRKTPNKISPSLVLALNEWQKFW